MALGLPVALGLAAGATDEVGPAVTSTSLLSSGADAVDDFGSFRCFCTAVGVDAEPVVHSSGLFCCRQLRFFGCC
jgi:hypothetical protein